MAAICHAPWTLIEADVVRDRTLTSWPSLRTDLTNAGATWVAERLVVDGNRSPVATPATCRRSAARSSRRSTTASTAPPRCSERTAYAGPGGARRRGQLDALTSSSIRSSVRAMLSRVIEPIVSRTGSLEGSFSVERSQVSRTSVPPSTGSSS